MSLKAGSQWSQSLRTRRAESCTEARTCFDIIIIYSLSPHHNPQRSGGGDPPRLWSIYQLHPVARSGRTPWLSWDWWGDVTAAWLKRIQCCVGLHSHPQPVALDPHQPLPPVLAWELSLMVSSSKPQPPETLGIIGDNIFNAKQSKLSRDTKGKLNTHESDY